MATALPQQRRALYRHALRDISALLNSRPERANLARLLRPQLRAFVQLPDEQWDNVQQRIASTVALLESSPRLTHNLSSLSYNHYPGPIPHTSQHRGNRSTIAWNPAQPEAARKAHLAQDRRRATQKTFAQLAEQALGECVRMAEGQKRVLLGRIL